MAAAALPGSVTGRGARRGDNAGNAVGRGRRRGDGTGNADGFSTRGTGGGGWAFGDGKRGGGSNSGSGSRCSGTVEEVSERSETEAYRLSDGSYAAMNCGRSAQSAAMTNLIEQ